MIGDEKYLMFRAQEGSADALDKLVKANNGLIWSIVKRFKGRGYELEDLYQIGCIGFIKSVKRFNMNFDYKISTFAVPYIMGEIKKFIRDDGMIKVSRSVKELGIKIKEIEKEYLNKCGEQITVKKMSEILNVSEENIYIAIDAGRQVESINDEKYENNSVQKINYISNRVDEQSRIVDKIVVNDMVENLGIRDKAIIKLRFFKEKTQTQVAKILGISQVQVSRIEKKILEQMKEKMVG